MQKNKMKLPLLILVLIFTVGLLVTGLVACNDSSEYQDMSNEEKIMSLIEKSFFFESAPESLVFGEAIQDSFTDQGVTIKYLGAFSDGEGFYLFLDIIDEEGNFFGKQDVGYTLAINDYDFLEKAGYTDSKIYEILAFDTKERTTTVCVEYIGLLEEDNISFHIYSMDGDLSKENNEITGDWELKFAIKDSLLKPLEANKLVTYNGYDFLVQRAVISPIKITLFAARNDVPEEISSIQPEDLEYNIIYKDGETATILDDPGYVHGNQKGYMFRINYTPKNFEDIVGLEVNGVLFPVVE